MKISENMELNNLICEIIEIQNAINNHVIQLNNKIVELSQWTLGGKTCTISKKSEPAQTKNLPSFLKKPTSQEEKKADN